MTDVHSPKVRSKNMQAIRGVNTKPEIDIRKLLFGAGYRYRIAPQNLPSKPDLYLPKYKSAILINGCFWHGHKCHLFHWPKTREKFWKNKINSTIKRDKKNTEALNDFGLKVLVIWECALKGKSRLPHSLVLSLIERWLKEQDCNAEIDNQGLTLSTLDQF